MASWQGTLPRVAETIHSQSLDPERRHSEKNKGTAFGRPNVLLNTEDRRLFKLVPAVPHPWPVQAAGQA
jgi:hypothetical protein